MKVDDKLPRSAWAAAQRLQSTAQSGATLDAAQAVVQAAAQLSTFMTDNGVSEDHRLWQLKIALQTVCDMLPAYTDPAWDQDPDNLRCDIDYARRLIARVLDNG